MKKAIFLFLATCSFHFAFSQEELLVQNSDKGLYLPHVVAAKENYYSIGRLYNVSPKDIETFNGLDMSKGLVIGQTVKIPLNATNFSQSSNNGRPVYYIVGEKEGLYRVSVKNNNVLMANLRKWNHLASDGINAGKKLIVGYLVSPEAAQVAATPAPQKVVEAEKKDVVISEIPAGAKDLPKKESKPVSQPAVQQMAVNDGNGGYFRSLYAQQVKSAAAGNEQSVAAGIFKTASGWQDAKYYVLIDRVEPGTIVKIVNPANNKAVYAKVLGEMSGIRQNQGYDMRMSNAAAAALDISDTEKFIVRVNY